MNFLVIALIMILGVGVFYEVNLTKEKHDFFGSSITDWRIWNIMHYPYWQIFNDAYLEELLGKQSIKIYQYIIILFLKYIYRIKASLLFQVLFKKYAFYLKLSWPIDMNIKWETSTSSQKGQCDSQTILTNDKIVFKRNRHRFTEGLSLFNKEKIWYIMNVW